RASRDGNTVAAFHEKCDNKGATIVIAKIPNSEKIIGGYNPLFWELSSGIYKSTNGSFIFSFADRNNFQSAKVGNCNDNQKAIYCNSNYGPIFGGGRGDLVCNNNGTWYGNSQSYPKIDNIQNNSYFKVDDYEVFQVVKM